MTGPHGSHANWTLRGACGYLLLATTPVQAEISFVDMFRSNTFVQTADGNSLTVGGSFFTLGLTSTNAGDYDTVDATYPGPASPVSLSSISPTEFSFQTPTYPTQADMDANFPVGTYQFLATNSGGSNSTSFNYAADHYAASLPFLAAPVTQRCKT